MSTQLSAVVSFDFTVFAEVTRWLTVKLNSTCVYESSLVFVNSVLQFKTNTLMVYCAAWSSSSSTFTKSQITRNQ